MQSFRVLNLLLLYPVSDVDDLAHHRLGILLEGPHLIHLLLPLLRVLWGLAILLNFFHRVPYLLTCLVKQRGTFCSHTPGVSCCAYHPGLVIQSSNIGLNLC